MAGKKRLKLGDIYEIGLPNGKKAYARLFKEYTLAIYKGFYNHISELLDGAEYFRFIGVYRDLLQDGAWKIVGNRPFQSEEDAWPPPRCVVDAITKRGSLYHRGKIIPCACEQCRDLEVVAAWDRRHVVDMLMGDTRVDQSIRKPVAQ